MELFRADMSEGLLPKNFSGVLQELLNPAFGYDAAPQIGCAYEWTGQMAGPSPAPAGLRSAAARALYDRYATYYRQVLAGEKPWPPPVLQP